MAEQFAQVYGDLPWRAIVTSTRSRTIATAAPVAARAGLIPVCDPRLDEIQYGAWQGMSKTEAQAHDPERYARWRVDPTVGPPGGEPPVAVCERALAAIAALQAAHADGNVLVVSHKTVLRLIVCKLLGLDLRHYRERVAWPTGAVSLLGLAPEGAIARVLGDVAHLATPLTQEPSLPLLAAGLGAAARAHRTRVGAGQAVRRGRARTRAAAAR
jgi:broad specificity phosphatase PhoE